MTERIFVSLISPNRLLKECLKTVIPKNNDIEFIILANDEIEFINEINLYTVKPEICIIDNEIGITELYKIINYIKVNFAIKMLVLSFSYFDDALLKILATGVNGVILKTDSVNELIIAIKQIHSNSTYFSAECITSINGKKEKQITITPKEKNLYNLVWQRFNL